MKNLHSHARTASPFVERRSSAYLLLFTVSFFLFAAPAFALDITVTPPPEAPKKSMNFNRAKTLLKDEATPNQEAAPLPAPEPGTSLPLKSPETRALIGKLEAYLNSIKTLEARFTQANSDGALADGKIFLSRPGKMRLEYDPPNKNLLVADGAFVHVWDDAAQATSSVPLGSSLADIILRKDVKLSGDLVVTAVVQHPALVELTLRQRENPDLGSITLEFEDRPLQLRNWRVMDAQGLETRVALHDARMDGKLASSLFYYRDPGFGGKKR